MRRKVLSNAKLIIKVLGNKDTKKIKTISVYDNRIQEFLNEKYIKERNIEWFLNLNDLKETLNWNLNGVEAKFQFKWGERDNNYVEGVAYVFD
ncbi:hypothetical protein QTH09_15715 [Clostridium perfringens]|nr:hypothetical protein [Clostridium perfringens]